MSAQLERSELLDAILKLKGDFPLFAATALKIITKDGNLAPLNLNAAQSIVNSLAEKQLDQTKRVRVIVLKARQEGISTLVAARLTWRLWLSAYRRGAVIADELARAGIIFSIYERYSANAPAGIQPTVLRSQRARELGWESDSAITVDTARDTDVGRGSTIHYLHLSELASWAATEKTDARQSFNSVMETVPRLGSEVYIESTAKGYGNLFQNLWEQAVAGENDWLPIFLPWWIDAAYELSPSEVSPGLREEIELSTDPFERESQDTGIFWPATESGDDAFHKLSVQQLAWRRTKIREKNETLTSCPDFTQENPATADEAFLVTGGAFFEERRLQELAKATRTTKPARWTYVAKRLQRSERGSLRIYEMPSEAGHYVMGADTATGLEVAASPGSEDGGRDYSVCDIIKVGTWQRAENGSWLVVPCRTQVAQFHARIDPDLFAEVMFMLGGMYACRTDPMTSKKQYEQALLVIERNHSSAQSSIRRLRDMGYQRLYRKRRANVVGDRKPQMEYGFWTDGGSRRMILDAFAAHVREDRSGVSSPDTVKEMFQFVMNSMGKPQAQDGTHDDRVMSYALALEGERWHRHADSSSIVPGPTRRSTPTGV